MLLVFIILIRKFVRRIKFLSEKNKNIAQKILNWI